MNVISIVEPGETEKLRRVLHQHQAMVHALVSRMLVSDPGSVDDVCQEALIKVVRGLPRFDPRGPAPIERWILTIATRTAIDHLRRRSRLREEVTVTLDQRPADVRTPEACAADTHEVARVEAVMASLADDYRIALVLRAYHDLDYAEIAEVLGVQVGTVKSRIARARAELRRALATVEEVTHV